MNDQRELYLLIDGKQEGPFGIGTIRQMCANGEVLPSTPCAVAGEDTWKTVGSFMPAAGFQAFGASAVPKPQATRTTPAESGREFSALYATVAFFLVAGFIGFLLLFAPEFVAVACIALLGVPLYFLPAIIAIRGEHHNATAIVVLNLLLGWTFLGWVLALVWSLTSSPRRAHG